MATSLRRALVVVGILVAGFLPARARAQARNGRLIVTVIDQTGGVLAGAVVKVTGLEDATKRTAVAPVTASDRGVATVENLAPGRYAIETEFPGFEKGVVRDTRVRAGDNRQTVTLALSKLSDSTTVEVDRAEAASDRATTFGTALTREQIDALSEDPDELRRQLQDMTGPDAVISVDSFEGQQLPHKSQIKSIRISRDQFAAEIHQAGFPRIDVVTQPGVGPFRGGFGFNFYDSAMDGVNPLVDRKGPAQSGSVNTYVQGTAIPNRLGYFLSIFGTNGYNTPTLYFNTADGRVSQNADVKQVNQNLSLYGGFEYALTKDQVLRVQVGRSGNTNENLGVGTYNQVERAYTQRFNSTSLYAQQMGPLGRRFVLNTRLSLNINDQSSVSAVDAPTYLVTEAFNIGGAQQKGGTRSRAFYLGSDLDYVRGIHSFRTGIQLDGTSYRSDSTSNYLGTYTFESREAYETSTPRSFTRRIGDPNVQYANLQLGVYVQDDIRLKKNLTLTPGVRYEAQTHLKDYANFGPRVGITWAPFKNGRTTLRASAGIFYDWLNTNIYQQTLQVDGFRLQELNITNPSFPDPGQIGITPPTNRYLLGGDLVMAQNARLSAGISQGLGRQVTVTSTYAYIRGAHLLVGENLNAPVNGTRPDPSFANIVQAIADGLSRQHTLTTTVNVNFASPGAPPPVPGTGRLWDWKRSLAMNGTYTLASNRNNTDGAFSTPATNTLESEWGPAAGDVRQRVNVGVTTGAVRRVMARVGVNRSSAPPLTIRTGTDDNGDLVFNDRPAGVGRNSVRTSGQWSSDAGFSYAFTLGKKAVDSGGGISITGSPAGGFTVNTIASQSVPRYRLNLNVNIQNLTNHANYSGYGSVMTSPGFLKPNSAFGTRRVNISMNVSF